MQSFELDNGKYKIEYNEATSELIVRRYDEIWRNHTGDKFMLAVFNVLNTKKKEEQKIKDEAFDAGYKLGFFDGYHNCVA